STYDGFGELTQRVSPDTGTSSSTYDSGGNVATSTDARGALTVYAYDALNRVVSRSYSIGGVTDQTVTLLYDSGSNGKGRLTSASDANQSLAWTYDSLGRVASRTQTVGNRSLTTGFTYTNGNLTTVSTPAGRSINYTYNSNHQIASVAVNGI
ncbi:hypothetical protein ED328_16470, partial [Muribaculaceae bacterium Isolate-001 (NCI)]